jgi:glycosyltransferase involved in cell wall biosynthesis
MRIGFFSPTINRIGGGEWVTLNMIHALKVKKHTIVIHSAEKIDPVHIQRFFGRNLDFDEVAHWPSIFDPYDLESIYPNCLKSFLFSVKCDLLIDTFSNALLPWTDAVYFQGASKASYLPKGLKGLLFSPYKTLLIHTNSRVRPEEKILMTCSKFSAKLIQETTGLYVKVLYPPVSDFFKDKNVNNQPRNDVVVTVARVSHDKRLETIPQIAKLVSNDVSFIIIGNCKLPHELNVLNRLQETIRTLGMNEKVKVLLNISREKQRDLLQRSKVYLHPFLPFEAFGVSAVEAMSAGCVSIVPDIGGLKEIVPKKLRYTSVEEAASLVDASIANWSPRKAQESIDIANKFSQTNFQKEFLKIMKL